MSPGERRVNVFWAFVQVSGEQRAGKETGHRGSQFLQDPSSAILLTLYRAPLDSPASPKEPHSSLGHPSPACSGTSPFLGFVWVA